MTGSGSYHQPSKPALLVILVEPAYFFITFLPSLM